MMRGYIALSRALAADGVLIPRPFAPTLFMQKEQPFPTLLLDTMLGKEGITEKTLPTLWAKAAEDVKTASKRQKLVDTTWECGVCSQPRPARDFMSKNLNADDWCEDFLGRVLAPGPFRRCSVCSPSAPVETWKCYACNLRLPREELLATAWWQKYFLRAVRHH